MIKQTDDFPWTPPPLLRAGSARNSLPQATDDCSLRLVAGVDLYAPNQGSSGVAALVVMEFPSLTVVYEDYERVHLQQPYIAGFLAFREVSGGTGRRVGGSAAPGAFGQASML